MVIRLEFSDNDPEFSPYIPCPIIDLVIFFKFQKFFQNFADCYVFVETGVIVISLMYFYEIFNKVIRTLRSVGICNRYI